MQWLMNTMQDDWLWDGAYIMQLYEPKIQDIRQKMTLYGFSSHIYIIWYGLAISHKQALFSRIHFY